ncbi:hypothetical protein E7T09_04110 [Deinococcus sp. KSM4-11]|uniref:hypothetical protein n=1 Tax=Deinococcus sp. KSM4-11 TaxID=2568654 RepID=UPI0010A45EBD|nr:hypothetical protein [Deinococcus sp. KSM4-11]THF88398.1 hypothetical protein E7T09_04110 [Deinococcus sp. KSM4-11]
MPRYDLKRAQRAALMALGENGESVIANLEAVGLVIVHKSDLPREVNATETRTVDDVRLQLPDRWADPYYVTVHGPPDGPLKYGVEFDAINGVREAHQLQQTLRYQVSVTLDDKAELVTAVTARPPGKAPPITHPEGGDPDAQAPTEATRPEAQQGEVNTRKQRGRTGSGSPKSA